MARQSKQPKVKPMPEGFDTQTDWDSNQDITPGAVAMPAGLVTAKELNAKAQEEQKKKEFEAKHGFKNWMDDRNPELWEGADIGGFDAQGDA